jgi:hypothetical protein
VARRLTTVWYTSPISKSTFFRVVLCLLTHRGPRSLETKISVRTAEQAVQKQREEADFSGWVGGKAMEPSSSRPGKARQGGGIGYGMGMGKVREA